MQHSSQVLAATIVPIRRFAGQVRTHSRENTGHSNRDRMVSRSNHARFARAKMLCDAFNHAVIARRVPAFEIDQDLVIEPDQMPLELDQLGRQPPERFLIGFGISFFSS